MNASSFVIFLRLQKDDEVGKEDLSFIFGKDGTYLEPYILLFFGSELREE